MTSRASCLLIALVAASAATAQNTSPPAGVEPLRVDIY
jgi:hypothetical protein